MSIYKWDSAFMRKTIGGGEEGRTKRYTPTPLYSSSTWAINIHYITSRGGGREGGGGREEHVHELGQTFARVRHNAYTGMRDTGEGGGGIGTD